MRCDKCKAVMDPDVDVQFTFKRYHPLVDAEMTWTYCGPECVKEALT